MRLMSRAVLAVSLAVVTSGAVIAATPATGLGQSWPNAADVSVHPHFHVYRFELGGVTYIQVNDSNGNVLGSVGTVGGQFITLPIGRFAPQVTTPSQPAAASVAVAATAAPATVYNDGATAITATPLSDGTLRLSAASTCDPVDCNIKVQALSTVRANGAGCDPVECNIKVQTLSTGTMRANDASCDPVECNIKAQ
jgi:hypothetical protein